MIFLKLWKLLLEIMCSLVLNVLNFKFTYFYRKYFVLKLPFFCQVGEMAEFISKAVTQRSVHFGPTVCSAG